MSDFPNAARHDLSSTCLRRLRSSDLIRSVLFPAPITVVRLNFKVLLRYLTTRPTAPRWTQMVWLLVSLARALDAMFPTIDASDITSLRVDSLCARVFSEAAAADGASAAGGPAGTALSRDAFVSWAHRFVVPGKTSARGVIHKLKVALELGLVVLTSSEDTDLDLCAASIERAGGGAFDGGDDEHAAATKMQSQQSKTARAEVQDIRDQSAAATKMQSIQRSKTARAEVQEIRDQSAAATKMQSVQRSKTARAEVQDIRDQSAAATKMQSIQRSKTARAEVAEMQRAQFGA